MKLIDYGIRLASYVFEEGGIDPLSNVFWVIMHGEPLVLATRKKGEDKDKISLEVAWSVSMLENDYFGCIENGYEEFSAHCTEEELLVKIVDFIEKNIRRVTLGDNIETTAV